MRRDNIRGTKNICTHNYSRTAVYIEKFPVVLEHFPKTACAKHLLVTTAIFLTKCVSTLAHGIVSISEINRTNDNTVSKGPNAENEKHIKGTSRLH